MEKEKIKKTKTFSHYFLPSKELKIDKREITQFSFKYCDFLFNFKGIKGVFSKDKLDLGTKKLIENLITPKKGLVLDLGCGTGVIGTVIYNFTFNNVIFSDVNYKAVYIAKKNFENNKYETKTIKQKSFFIVANGLKVFKKRIFDSIYFYPPEKLGKEKIKEILGEVSDYLKKEGFLIFVITKKMKWLLEFLKEKSFRIEILEKSSYIVFKAEKINNK